MAIYSTFRINSHWAILKIYSIQERGRLYNFGSTIEVIVLTGIQNANYASVNLVTDGVNHGMSYIAELVCFSHKTLSIEQFLLKFITWEDMFMACRRHPNN